jgi:hypothetical protein
MNKNIKKVKTQRKQDLILYEKKYILTNSILNGLKRWRCQKRKCKASLVTDSELKIIKLNKHKHKHNLDLNTSKAEKALVLGKINNCAYNTKEMLK